MRNAAQPHQNRGGRRDGQAGYLLRPPSVPPYTQLVQYLNRKPDPGPTRRTGRELDAIAATALTIRWGSYYAVLADLNHQNWRFDGSIDVCSICEVPASVREDAWRLRIA